MNTSFKGMLRDRCPETVDLALKWCKAKTKWVDHCYNNFIRFYKIKDERNEATRICLGLSHKYRNFDFSKTINWDDLTKEETQYWKWVESWVKWFCTQMLFIEEEYKYIVQKRNDEFGIKVDIIGKFLSFMLPADSDNEDIKAIKYKQADDLADHIMDYLKKQVGYV